VCSPSPAPIVKGDRFEKHQCLKNQYEIDRMKVVPYALAVRSIQYAQVCTRPDLAFVTGLLSRYEKNLKKVLRYL
jgi:hypothetical protein